MPGKVNWTEAKSFSPLSGTYEGTFMGLTFVEKSKSSGKPAATFDFTLTDPEVEGRKVKSTKSLAPEGMWATKQWLVALGADPEDVEADMDDIEEYASQFIGNTVQLVLSVGSFTDQNTKETRVTQQIDAVKSQYAL